MHVRHLPAAEPSMNVSCVLLLQVHQELLCVLQPRQQGVEQVGARGG